MADQDDPCDQWSAAIPTTKWDTIKVIYQRWMPPILVVLSLVWLLVVLRFKPPHPPIGVYIAGLALVVAEVTIWPPESNWSKAVWLAVFFTLTGLEITTLYQERSENQEQQTKAREQEHLAFQSIADGIEHSISNSDKSFAATMSKMERLATLSVEGKNTVTGGDSFCYLVLTNSNNPIIIHKGRYPLYGVQVRVVDLVKMRLLEQQHHPIDPLQDDFIFNAGDLTVGLALNSFSLRVTFTDPDKQDFNVFFTAKNGLWDEKLRIRRINTNRQTAIKVFRGDKNGKAITLFESVPKDFPKSELDSDW